MTDLPLITGFGAALVDLFADVSDAELDAIGSPKASMTLIDAAQSRALQKTVSIHTQLSGGSAANSIAGLAALGLPTGFIGKIADDDLGDVFRADFHKNNVAFPMPPIQATTLPTGHCVVLVTPDGERTLHTVLGASVTTSLSDLDDALLARTGLLFAEGYIWDSPSAKQAFIEAAARVHAQGGKVAFSLANSFCVERHHGDFLALLDDTVDIVLANAEEAAALLGSDRPETLAAYFAQHKMIAAVTYGADGAYVFTPETHIHVAAQSVSDIVDLTGAGDQFAAGFLAGWHKGLAIEDAAQIGIIAASEVIRHFGPRPQSNIGELIAKQGLVL